MVQFSDDQKKLVSEIGKFTRDPNKTEFVVHGLAGTGKTTVATRLAQYFSNSILCAFTNRAANILSEKSGLTAHTIHRVLYGIPTKVIDEKGRVQLKFSDKKQPPGSLKGMIIFVDECSMLNETIVNDLRDTGAKLIFLGDHGQLPPVQGKSAITKADFTLTEIHRQAAESPIIQQAYNVRTRRDYYAVGDEFRVTRSLDHGSLLQSDIVLCWKNATRARMNQECRTARGISGYPKKGEPAMLYSNRTHAGLFKGQVFTLAEDIKAEGDDIWLYAEGQESGDIWRVKNGWFFDSDKLPDADWKVLLITFGYATTVHFAQGSEFSNVTLIDEFPYYHADRSRWLYTGITRARDSIVMCKNSIFSRVTPVVPREPLSDDMVEELLAA